jgi:hypothetical protein
VPEYRAYFIGPDGHIFEAVVLHAPHDTAAIEAAEQLVDGNDVELWQLDRKIAKLERKEAGHEYRERPLGEAP